MKTINWKAVRAATPGSVTCNHCQRPDIVVDKTTGLRAPHYTTAKSGSSRKNKRGRVPCEGGGKHYDSRPAGTT